MRLVIQSGSTGQFLAPSFDDGQPEWVTLLREACVVSDFETCAQIIEDHTDVWSLPYVVDLEKLHNDVSF